MWQGLIWLFASVFSAIALIQTIPKAIGDAAIMYRKRNVEPSTKGLPTAACPVDGGTWGPWSKIQEESHPNNVRYPSISGFHFVRSQTRQCRDCGFAERRVL